MAAPAAASQRRQRRKGRGTLSSIDLLPDECEEDIVWVKRELARRQLTQTEILDEFNVRLSAKGHGPISKGAFSRYSVNAALLRREAVVGTDLSDLAYEILPKEGEDDPALVVRELLKLRLLTLMSDQDSDPKAISALSLAMTRVNRLMIDTKSELRRDEADQRDTEERERKALAEAERQTRERVASAAENATQIATEAGLSAERVAAIRRGVLGLAG